MQLGRLLNRVTELAVEQGRMVGVMQSDPVITRFLAEHRPFQAFLEHLYAALIGDATSRPHLLRLTRRLVDLPG